MTSKLFALLSVSFLMSPAFGQVKALSTPSASGFPAYEVIIEGPVAEKLFKIIHAATYEVKSSAGTWTNKTGNGIICGQNQKTEAYACALVVDEAGIQF